jgi:hypothetical protein
MTRRFATTGLATLLGLISLVAACGNAEPVDVQITVAPGIERLDDLTRLDYRVYTVEDVDEVIATATNPNGSPVQAISCEVLQVAAPDATDCSESERRVTRDQDLVGSGRVPADGIIPVPNDERVRVYASLQPGELRIDEHGHVCSWNGNDVLEAGATGSQVVVRPFC